MRVYSPEFGVLGSLEERELCYDIGESHQDDCRVESDRQPGQLPLLPLVLHVHQAREEEDDDESTDGAGKADDRSDGRIEDGEGDADGDNDEVDAGDVEHLLLLATDQKQESLEKSRKLNKACFKRVIGPLCLVI